MNRIDEYLEVLELSTVPDMDTLEQNYRELLKRNHPDVNRGQEEKAHLATRRIIEATHVLRQYIHNMKRRQANGGDSVVTVKTRKDSSPVYDSTDLQKTYTEVSDFVRVQLMRSGQGDFGLPVAGIESILFRKDTVWFAPEEVIIHNEQHYPVEDFSSPDSDSGNSPVVLYRQNDQRVAVIFERNLHFSGIADISPREIIDTGSKNGLFRYRAYLGGQSYGLPSLG